MLPWRPRHAPHPNPLPWGEGAELLGASAQSFGQGRCSERFLRERPMIRRVRIDGLAPTGEGVARTPEGVGFVAGALPGEEVDAEVGEFRKKFWKGRVVGDSRSPLRTAQSGGHADGCAGCDWAHLDLARARDFKRALFLETMERIGRLPREPFGELPVVASPPGYRLRNRFHVTGRGASAEVGFFAPRSHRVEPAGACEALSEGMRALMPRLAAAVAAERCRRLRDCDGRKPRRRAAPRRGGPVPGRRPARRPGAARGARPARGWARRQRTLPASRSDAAD